MYLYTNQASSYTYTRDFRITKLMTKYQALRSSQPLPNGKVTTIKIKLIQGFIFIFGAATI
jgi:hypothetical protein